MDSLNCLSYKRLVILHKLRCANCVTKILYFFHTTKLSVPVFSNFCLHTEFLFVPNYRIIEFLSSHGISRTVTDFSFFLFLSRIIEFSNFIFLVPRLVLGPTDRREVIIELSNFMFLSRDLSFVPNYRIIEFLSSVTFRDSPCENNSIIL